MKVFMASWNLCRADERPGASGAAEGNGGSAELLVVRLRLSRSGSGSNKTEAVTVEPATRVFVSSSLAGLGIHSRLVSELVLLVLLASFLPWLASLLLLLSRLGFLDVGCFSGLMRPLLLVLLVMVASPSLPEATSVPPSLVASKLDSGDGGRCNRGEAGAVLLLLLLLLVLLLLLLLLEEVGGLLAADDLLLGGPPRQAVTETPSRAHSSSSMGSKKFSAERRIVPQWTPTATSARMSLKTIKASSGLTC